MKGRRLFASIFPKNEMLGPVNTNDVVAAAPNEANQGARREVWWSQMNAEQRRVASFGAQPAGFGLFSVLLRYRKLICNKHTSLAKPCRNEKMAESTPAELVLTGPSQLLWPVAARIAACFQGFEAV